jgi:hypothetical protein
LEEFLGEFSSNDEIVESTCRCVKHSIRTLKSNFEPYLQPFLVKVTQGYQLNPSGSFIYAVENCFGVFGTNSVYENIFSEAFNFIISKTNEIMHPTLFDQEPDLINDFFSLASKILTEA